MGASGTVFGARNIYAPGNPSLFPGMGWVDSTYPGSRVEASNMCAAAIGRLKVAWHVSFCDELFPSKCEILRSDFNVKRFFPHIIQRTCYEWRKHDESVPVVRSHWQAWTADEG
jgi:hypothetical protein